MATAKKTPAKKAPAKKQTPIQETVVAEAPTVNIGKESYATPPMPTKPKWEYRDRLYEITKNKKPLVYSIPTRHSAKVPLLLFDEEKGYQR